MCTVKNSHMMYGSWDMECNGQDFLSFTTVFCPFTPLKTQKNQNFEKKEKTPGDIIILHRYTINDNHMLHGSRGFSNHFLPPVNSVKKRNLN